MTVDAVFENGVLRLLTPIDLHEHERVTLVVRREGDEEEGELFDTEYMDACAARADDSITIEEVRARLSKIKGSMDEVIDLDRGEY